MLSEKTPELNLNHKAALLAVIIFKLVNISEAEIAVGYGLDIFRHWGDVGNYFGADNKNVMKPVFENPLAVSRNLEGQNRILVNGGVQIELCHNVNELLAVLYRPYYVERSKSPWKLYSSGWKRSTIAKKLGLNSTYLNEKYNYALVKMSKFRQSVTLDLKSHDQENIVSQLQQNIQYIVPGDTQSVMRFFSTSGSHYVSSFITGESIYQVFVYASNNFPFLKEEIHNRGGKPLTQETYVKLFSPLYSVHIGNIRSMGDDYALENWANTNLILTMYLFSYPSLIKAHIDPKASQVLNYLMGNNALLHVDLRSMELVIGDFQKRFWFQQVMDNYMKLWEENG